MLRKFGAGWWPYACCLSFAEILTKNQDQYAYKCYAYEKIYHTKLGSCSSQ